MVEPELASFIRQADESCPPGAQAWPIARQRAAYEAYAKAAAPARPGGVVAEDARLIEGGRGVGVRLYRPRASAPGLLLYFHGGGFSLGSLESHDAIVRRLAASLGVASLAIDYRLAPEHPYPAALEDAVAVARAAIARTLPFDLDDGRIALAGDSAGGNLAAATALACGEVPHASPFAALATIYAAFAPDPTAPSRDEEANAPMLTLAAARACLATYLGGRAPEALACPLLSDRLGVLPPTLAIAVQHDPLRDDSAAMVARLQSAGVEAQLWIGSGLVHGCLRAIDRSPGARALWATLTDFLRARVAGSASPD